jgi:hypothetical protein
MSNTVNIRPGVSILSVLRHLNYKHWFAMGEFVDNSLESFLRYRKELKKVDGSGYQLKVEIELDFADEPRITIRDNAAGIHAEDYPRAFRPAAIPPERTGLAEFGMGMKSAACWFAPQWTVRTSALGEEVERTVSFDIGKIVRDELEELGVQRRTVEATAHFTEITLVNLHRPPLGRTVTKIKEHLASIYRTFIRDGVLELVFDGDVLKYEEPRILNAAHYKQPSGPAKVWRKDIDFDFGLGLKVTGFAALRDPASTTHAGFALFRRGRLIEGSADEGYRPEFIFGKPNSYRYQRLFGELHLEGFEVSHTKDGFRWDEHEETFLQLLKEILDSKPLPLLEQAEEYRVKANTKELQKGAEIATQRTATVIEREVPPVLEQEMKAPPQAEPPPKALEPAGMSIKREIIVDLSGVNWKIVLETTSDPAVGDWLSVSDRSTAGKIQREITVRVALAHPFMERFGGSSYTEIEPLVRVAAAIGLAETAARYGGVKSAGTIRRNINELLRNALSKP